ncbi:MAG: M20 family metallopeptidase [Dehalococcoidia bacterium]
MSSNAVRPAVDALVPGAIALRRDLHQHAELSFEEHRTQKVITERLRALGLDDVRAIARTGVTAIVRGARPGPNLCWRADIDALPLEEQTGLPFASTNGAMHACGHDGHVAIALAMAELLQRHRDALAGTVRFAFQPAEERIGGAKPMIEEGVLEEPRVDNVYGLHIMAHVPIGAIRVREGPVFAAGTHLRIIIRGRGGHASAPHDTVDPIVVAGHAIVALQTVVSRSIDPSETCVVTIGRIEGGVRGNIIPNEVMMSGTVRTYSNAVQARAIARMDDLLRGVCLAFGAEYQFDYSTLPAVVNDAGCAAVVARAGEALLGASHVAPEQITGSDDMAYFLEARPGAYFMLGGGNAAKGITHSHHMPLFDFDEDCIPLGIELGLRIIEDATGSALVV